MVPRGGIQVNEIWLRLQVVVVRTATALTNRNTNKIFLWTGSVPKRRPALYGAGIPALKRCYLGWPSSSPRCHPVMRGFESVNRYIARPAIDEAFFCYRRHTA